MKNNLKEIVIVFFIILIIGGIVYIVSNKKKEMEPPMNDRVPENKNQDLEYKGTKEITSAETINNETYTGSESDTNVVLVSGNIIVNMDGVTINKKGDTNNSDNSSFYGINSGILVNDNANLNINNSNVNTSSKGANGLFSYNSNIIVKDTIIKTNSDLSGGIMVAGNGNITASNLQINTKGNSSAAIRSDRGGGNILVTEGVYETNGQGSPAIYSTANIQVSDAKLVSNHSEGIIIEGKNSIKLNNVDLIDTNDTLNGKSTTYKNIFIYQSMSGDAVNGEAALTIKDSKITTNNGDTIYVTNTDANITLENNEFINNDDMGYFIRVKKDSWGIDGMNGGVVNLNLNNQTIEGNVYIDDISTLNINMSNSSYYEGTINSDNTGAKIELVLDKKSKIKLTGDSYITTINDANRAYTNIDFNGYKLYVEGTPIN